MEIQIGQIANILFDIVQRAFLSNTIINQKDSVQAVYLNNEV